MTNQKLAELCQRISQIVSGEKERTQQWSDSVDETVDQYLTELETRSEHYDATSIRETIERAIEQHDQHLREIPFDLPEVARKTLIKSAEEDLQSTIERIQNASFRVKR